MKKRDLYLTQLVQFKDKPLIKVVTGIRRCGKSTLLSLFEEHLRNSGVRDDHIIRMNFEAFEFDKITTYVHLYNYIKNRMTIPNQKYYIILDEVQQVESWEKAINSFLVDSPVDIYITGSNAYLLSSELSTLLSGRYVEIKMLRYNVINIENLLIQNMLKDIILIQILKNTDKILVKKYIKKENLNTLKKIY